MPYVPVPQGATAISIRDDVFVPWERKNPDGSIDVGVRQVAAVGNRLAYGKVERTKGKPTTVKGRKWSPVRQYFRAAEVMIPQPGPVIRVHPLNGALTRWDGLSSTPTSYDQVSARSAFLDTGWTTNMKNRINTELLQKVGQRKVNYGESLAEGRETINHLAKTVSTVVKALLAARKGRWDQVPKILGVPKKKLRNGASASDKWMEYQYGWLPMLGDINDSYELFKKGLTQGPQTFSAVRNISETLDESKALEKPDARFIGSTKIRHSAKIWYRIADSDISALHQLGLINPLEVAWAIVPYSFVFDWFIPVGNVLEAVSARMGVDFVDGYYGRSVESHYVGIERRSTTFSQLVSSGFVSMTDSFAYRRTRMPSLPWPGFYAKSPFSSTHTISALALLRQLWR